MRRSALSKVTLSLLALGLLGGGIVACGDDPAPAPGPVGDGDTGDGDGDGDGDSEDKDCMKLAGTSLEVQSCEKSDGESGFKICKNGKPSGSCKTQAELADPDSGSLVDICISVPMLQGQYAQCTGGKYQKCEDGEPTGNCKSLSELITDGYDGGLPDLGDAGSAECPTSGSFKCEATSVLGMELIPNKTCNINSGIYSAPPSDPSCTSTGAACTVMGLQGACITGLPIIGNVCAQPCP